MKYILILLFITSSILSFGQKSNNWTKEYKIMFRENCIKGIKDSGIQIKYNEMVEICQCEIEKVKKVYPDINTRYDPSVLMKIEEACGLQVLSKYYDID